MRRLFVIGIACVFLGSPCMAADDDAGKLADQIESETKILIDKASSPSQVSQIMGQAQLRFSRILMRQHDDIIQQNDKIIRQNEQIIQLLRNIQKQRQAKENGRL